MLLHCRKIKKKHTQIKEGLPKLWKTGRFQLDLMYVSEKNGTLENDEIVNSKLILNTRVLFWVHITQFTQILTKIIILHKFPDFYINI